jgi:hypothetical protein
MVAVYASLCVLLIDWTIAAILGVRVMARWCSDRLQYTRLIAGLLIDPSHMLFVVQAAVSWRSTALVTQNRKKKRKRKQQQPPQQWHQVASAAAHHVQVSIHGTQVEILRTVVTAAAATTTAGSTWPVVALRDGIACRSAYMEPNLKSCMTCSTRTAAS